MPNEIAVEGDKLTIFAYAAINLYHNNKFTIFPGQDPINGEIKYEKFSSGVNHGSSTLLNMPL